MSEKQISDRIGPYLKPHLNDYLFDELSDNYLNKAGVLDILKDVPVPINYKDVSSGITNVKIARNMAMVIGADPNFTYKDAYVKYIKRVFNEDFVYSMVQDGCKAANEGDYISACISLRGALILDPQCKEALYNYGRACLDAYSSEESEDRDFIGLFKAESLTAFEKLTIAFPDFAMGFFYLGYGYLNLGLYTKADLTWREFIKLASEEEKQLVEEIETWLWKLEEPLKMEQGTNLVVQGRFDEAIDILAPYCQDQRFNNWWYLWYSLGIAYRGIGQIEDAEAALKHGLTLSPSNLEMMKELVEVYKELGHKEKVDKYQSKIKLISSYNESGLDQN